VEWVELLQDKVQLQSLFGISYWAFRLYTNRNFLEQWTTNFSRKSLYHIFSYVVWCNLYCHFDINTSTEKMGWNLAVACFNCSAIYDLTFSTVSMKLMSSSINLIPSPSKSLWGPTSAAFQLKAVLDGHRV
jgi:hypothetical protein